MGELFVSAMQSEKAAAAYLKGRQLLCLSLRSSDRDGLIASRFCIYVSYITEPPYQITPLADGLQKPVTLARNLIIDTTQF